MKQYLVVDAARDWIDRRDVKPTDRIVAINNTTKEEHKILYIECNGRWDMINTKGEILHSVATFVSFFQDSLINKTYKFYVRK